MLVLAACTPKRSRVRCDGAQHLDVTCSIPSWLQLAHTVRHTKALVESASSVTHWRCHRGHNGKVKSLAWLPDDTKLVSAGVDGAVYEWKLKDFKRSKENVLKASLPVCFSCDVLLCAVLYVQVDC